MFDQHKYKNFPCLSINSQKLKYNIQSILQLLSSRGIAAHFSTKGIAAYEPIVKIMADSGVENFADSSLENLARVRPYAKNIILDRVPMLSEVQAIVQAVDISLNSELETIFALSDAAVVAGKKHGVILLLELGDLSAGILAEDIFDFVHQVSNLRGVELKGIRFDLNTVYGVRSTQEKLQQFMEIVEQIEERFELNFEYISAGNSGMMDLLSDEQIPLSFNHMILGQAWLFGRETSYQHRIMNLHQDIFSLFAEVVENKRKDSAPNGELGLNYKLESCTFKDVGVIRRVMLALGEQDVDVENLSAKEKGIEFLNSSLDYSIFNVSKYNHDLKIGDVIEFEPNYLALNHLCNSSRVFKVVD